jgi:hypothetical protein
MGMPILRITNLHRHAAGRPLIAVAAMAVACGVIASTGCRSGATAMSTPSWWSLGGSKTSDAEKLAAAPPFEGSIKKPSESAAPYPTTTTPNGYAVADTAAGQPNQPVAPPALAATEPAAITYGSPPAPAAMAAAAASTAVTAPPPQQAAPSIAPQVGPYAPLAGGPPAPSMAAVPATPFSAAAAPPAATSGAFPATAGYEPMPAAGYEPSPAGRTVDSSRFAASPAASPAPQSLASPQGVDPLSAASRYASIPGSRFGGASFGSSPPPLEPAMSAMPSAAALPAAAPPLSAAPPPLPAAPVLPGAPPPPAAPVTPPPRRPDPGYRPAGTSSYRPTRAILVEAAPAAPSAVRTASFETPAPAAP